MNFIKLTISHYIGVDVGSGSVRAFIINEDGNILSLEEMRISTEELKPEYITQSSEEIWESVCYVVKRVIEESKVESTNIKGIGFDATCSLVVIDKETGNPIAVRTNYNDNSRNIIMWMDHRVVKETDYINATEHCCLNYVGGKMSVEMELPKIKWLKNNMAKDDFGRCKFFDLVDYLTFKATNIDSRSFSSAVCKQGMLSLGVEGSTEGWSRSFLKNIKLEELTANDFAKIGGPIKANKDSRSFLSAG